MDRDLGDDYFSAYHMLPSEPGQSDDDRFCKDGAGPNPGNLAFSLLFVFVQYVQMMYIVYLRDLPVYYLIYSATYVKLLCIMMMLNKSNPGVLRKNTDMERYIADAAPATAVVVNNVRFIQRWCVECRIYRPPRVRHCYECQRCIARFDHHCPWLSTCIGAHNYKMFVYFGWLCFGISWYSLYFIALYISDLGMVNHEPLNYEPWCAFARNHTAVFGIAVCVVLKTLANTYNVIMQTYFIACNLTYYEYLMRPYPEGNPFNRGILYNLLEFLRLPFVT